MEKSRFTLIANKTEINDEEYIKYKNCYIAKSKLLYDSTETLIKETAALSRLDELGYEVYLLPYAYARNNMNFYQKSADSITAGEFLEMKSVISTGKRVGQSAYESARHQAANIYLSIVNTVSEETLINNIYRSIGQIKKENLNKRIDADFSGKLILNFEKTNTTSLYEISRDGKVIKITNPSYENFKEIKGTAYDSSQVVADPMTEHGRPRNFNIKKISKSVNIKTSDYEKLEDLDHIRENKATKIINTNTFVYDGLTYIPVRSLSENEKVLINNRSPKEYWKNSIIEKPKNGENYSVEDFNEKSQVKNADLFYCIERGKFFTPVENGIINLNEGSIDGHFRDELNNFYNNKNIQEVIKNHRPLVFNEKEDISLMQNISAVLKESEVFFMNNETLGDIRIKFGNPEHNGLSHIIKRRMDKLIKHENFSYDDAVKETSAILFLSLQNISEAPAIKETNGRYAIYKDGIKTAIDTDKYGKFVVTGFDFNDTKQEAADAIKSVNAQYGYAPEFLEIYAQAGAAYASLGNNVTQQNSSVNIKTSDYEKMLYSSAEIDVNGKVRHCKNGLIKGFENAVSLLDSTFAENSRLKDENLKLKSQLSLMNSKCEKLIQDNEELKNQALKNKIRPMGM